MPPKPLSEQLLEQLLNQCHELEEFGNAKVVSIDEEKKELIISLSYDDPEDIGEPTIFHCY